MVSRHLLTSFVLGICTVVSIRTMDLAEKSRSNSTKAEQEEKAPESSVPVALAAQANKNSAAPEQGFQQPAQPFKFDLGFYMGLNESPIEAADFSPGLVPRYRLRELALLRAWQHGLPNWKAEKSNL